MKMKSPAALVCLSLSGCLALGLDWKEEKGFRYAEVAVPNAGKTGFTRLTSQATGISFTNVLPESRYRTNQVLINGSGVAAGDVDGDGWCDLYFCRLEGPNVLYRNLGNWKFEDITAAAGVACEGQFSTGAVFADVNGDGALDLLVNALGGGTRLFLNDGHGHFTENTDQAGLRSKTASMSMALADVDGNGTLDLYVANFRPDTIKDEPLTKFHGQILNGRPVITEVNGKSASSPEYTNRFLVTPLGDVL